MPESQSLLAEPRILRIFEYNRVIHSHCLMTNHYHLLVEKPDANLSKGMRQLNGVFTQNINRKHG
nr:transposase [Pseudoalteromonas luteoviolacea]